VTDPLRRCPTHGVVDGVCPDCGTAGDVVLTADRRPQLSTFLSGALRHVPGDAGLDLDDAGWTPWADLVAAATDPYPWADAAAVEGVVATDPKGRFERDGAADGSRVRAAYGHSVDVTLDPTDEPIPDELYHGTAPRNVDAIEREGLRPMGRQQVHLSASVADAEAVGRRHAHAADPVVFVVDAAALLDAHRITKRGTETYAVDRVPPAYLTRR
jgi:putative RNA 2'-phosphotransferase